MSEELLPCPFCGSKPVLLPLNPAVEGNAWNEVRCDECMVGPSFRVSDDDPEFRMRVIADAWNTRPALIDHLEADGMVLVPREPTEAMLAAWCRAEDTLDMRGCYAAMLAAIPASGAGAGKEMFLP